jgi:hypothetical protein
MCLCATNWSRNVSTAPTSPKVAPPSWKSGGPTSRGAEEFHNGLLINAVAHGIETPEARRAAGKAELGQIILTIITALGIAVGWIGGAAGRPQQTLTRLLFIAGTWGQLTANADRED